MNVLTSKTTKFVVFDLEPNGLTEPCAVQESKSLAGVSNGKSKEDKCKSSNSIQTPNDTVDAKTISKSAAPTPKSFTRRDHLREIEIRVQAQWEKEKPYESNVDISRPKYFLNFPYPYMNGRLHLGHAFSLTKAEFTARFQRLQGYNVLFPFAFHCTGMPIQAAANKLRDEIAKFGNPPDFQKFESVEVDDEDSAVVEEKSQTVDAAAVIAAKSKGKKSKLIQKGQAGAPMRQWDILAKMVPKDEIASFADPLKWLDYFPPYGASDLKAFGAAIDWRRAFITTSANPYYDAFIRWQYNRLRGGGRIKFGKRANVYSILDGQVCADHDRATGEGVNPQEYTLIKLLVVRPFPEKSLLNNSALDGKDVYLAPATLRPETMYGQTNCYVLPEGQYGCYESVLGDVLIVSDRAARGMAYQGHLKVWGQAVALVTLKGADLLGLPLKAPQSVYSNVYTLPLLTISMGKGTGVVTSVPSDAPDDYVALRELVDKPLWREKFGITAEMVEPFAVVPIIEIEGYGSTSAVFMCEKLDIKSSKDTEKLKQAKDEVYLKGYYEGVMLIGECKGMKVCDAKPIIRQKMMEEGTALPYFEPESTVMSRSGEECVVALTDQWYLAYGEADWQAILREHIHSDQFNSYNDKILEAFDHVLGWLKEWACSRPFGLGTKLPWDDSWVIESLSDSTIYMAYYTIAHYFHGNLDNLKGHQNPSPSGIRPEDLSDEVFSYIFLNLPLPDGCTSNIPIETLNKMREEFEYWYPFDLRVSAKDLIQNHLTMCLYHHAEIWKDNPKLWPKGIYCNGHIMVDAEKMSKSKGNFLTLLECVEDYTADATRFACADAGDSMEDANYGRAVANQAITYLFVEEEWVRSMVGDIAASKLRSGEEFMFMDKAFMNEMDYLIEATAIEFKKLCFREGLHRCWFDLVIARDIYRDWSIKCDIRMHESIVKRFIQSITIMMSPITPHYCENIWSTIGNSGSINNAMWPSFTPYDRNIRKQYIFFNDFMKVIRQANLKAKPTGPTKHAQIYISSFYEPKRVTLLKFMQPLFNTSTNTFSSDLLKAMKEFLEGNDELKKDTKVLMQFGAFMRDEAVERGLDALATEMTFDQKSILEENSRYISSALELTSIAFINVDPQGSRSAGTAQGEEDVKDKKKADQAVPGKPSYQFFFK